MTPQAREDMLREKFEQWIKQAPFEKSVTRFSADWSAWPGGYQDISVDLAWQAWKESQSSCDPYPVFNTLDRHYEWALSQHSGRPVVAVEQRR